MKLWKGLFYSVWMCDRPIPQQNLCTELAELLSVLPTPNDDEGAAVIPFLRAFWATLSREWTSIDVLRMEKFLLLVRRVFGASLAWVGGGKRGKKDGAWTGTRADSMLRLLQEWPLESKGDLSKVPVGLRLHVIDIWVDETEKLELLDQESEDDSAEDTSGKVQFLDRIREIVEVQTKSTCKPVRMRARESMTDDRLPWNNTASPDREMADDDSDGRGSWDGFKD